MNVSCTLRVPAEQRLERGVMWDGTCTDRTLHSTRWDVGPATEERRSADIDVEDQPVDASCDRCGTPVPWDAPEVPCSCGEPDCSISSLRRFGGSRTLWSTEDGKLHPGDMHYAPWNQGEDHHCSGRWTNCDRKHLYVVLPNGHEWDIDSRANNCTLPEDFEHRCWVRTGTVPQVTAGKSGPTCSAGAGSILSGDYHGFLVDGVLTD